MSYDPVGDRIWIGDVGANLTEEVDLLDAPGLNFQWSYKEGTGNGFSPVPGPIIGTERGPLFEYGRGIGNCVIGGFVYRGAAMPGLVGKYLFGDNGTQTIFALEYDEATGGVVNVETVGIARSGNIWNGIASLGIDASGEPLVLQMGAGAPGGGTISRVRPAGASSGLTWQYPPLLSQTGLFSDLPGLTPVPSLIPYQVNSQLWTAGVAKRRWVMIPNDGLADTTDERIVYSENHAWQLPVGSVLVKHFEQPDDGAPLETRVLVHGVDGWGGVTYRWHPDGLEADLLEEGATETLAIEGETIDYLFPSRAQCRLCHTDAAGSVLGFRTRQLNSSISYPSGFSGNQIEAFSAAGFIPEVIHEEDLAGVVTSAALDDPSATIEHRVCSYLDSNCSHCHQPNGSTASGSNLRRGSGISIVSPTAGISTPPPAAAGSAGGVAADRVGGIHRSPIRRWVAQSMTTRPAPPGPGLARARNA